MTVDRVVTLQPKSAKPPIGKIREVFLSATVRDLGDARDAVQRALSHIQTGVFLQDCWNRCASDVVSMCLHQLEVASGYLGIFGFRYGWIPDASGKSITELECDWALKRWECLSFPPVFFFSPKIGSAVEQTLINRAEATLLDDYPHNPDERELLRKRQRAFVSRLCEEGRNVIFFSDVDDLQLRAIAAVSLWNTSILESASDSHRRDRRPEIPSHELGAIGRQPQLAALKNALFAREVRRDVAAMCAVVHGPPNNGHYAFQSYLSRWEEFEVGHEIEPGAPPHDSYDAQSVLVWCLGTLGREAGNAKASVEALAEVVIEQLANKPVVLLLKRVDKFTGRLTTFRRDFWLPLYDALSARWNPSLHQQRFTMIVVSHRQETVKSSIFLSPKPNDDQIDFRRLLILPSLGTLRIQDVCDWLDGYGLSRRRCVEVAEQVIGRGDPLEVYEQLKEFGVWNEIMESARELSSLPRS
jgi:hypothetical protein